MGRVILVESAGFQLWSVPGVFVVGLPGWFDSDGCGGAPMVGEWAEGVGVACRPGVGKVRGCCNNEHNNPNVC